MAAVKIDRWKIFTVDPRDMFPHPYGECRKEMKKAMVWVSTARTKSFETSFCVSEEVLNRHPLRALPATG
jgi:hypothetical protein